MIELKRTRLEDNVCAPTLSAPLLLFNLCLSNHLRNWKTWEAQRPTSKQARPGRPGQAKLAANQPLNPVSAKLAPARSYAKLRSKTNSSSFSCSLKDPLPTLRFSDLGQPQLKPAHKTEGQWGEGDGHLEFIAQHQAQNTIP